MTATFPTGVKSFSTKTDNVTTVHAVDVNDLQDEVTAIETAVEVTSANTAAAYSDNESPVSAAITFAGTPGAGKRVHIKAYRLGSGADNLASPALLDLIRLVYVRA
jgi:hypothetical protein